MHRAACALISIWTTNDVTTKFPSLCTGNFIDEKRKICSAIVHKDCTQQPPHRNAAAVTAEVIRATGIRNVQVEVDMGVLIGSRWSWDIVAGVCSGRNVLLVEEKELPLVQEDCACVCVCVCAYFL